jgi:hypothetical protein
MNRGSNKGSSIGYLPTNFREIFMNFGEIFNYELTTNYPRLIIKLAFILSTKLFYNFISDIKFEFKLQN